MNPLRETFPDVFVSSAHPGVAEAGIIPFLKERATASPRKRARWCAHPSPDAAVQEMLIALARGVYIPPHRHLGRSESMHVIEGDASLVMFTDEGQPLRTVAVGPAASGRVFYHRIDEPVFHTILVISEQLVFHETVQGPFVRLEAEKLAWIPPESNRGAVQDWMRRLERSETEARG